ncbi:MAG: hypothetical protein ACRDRJ_09205 [Streptosporangiaceae bacterium]
MKKSASKKPTEAQLEHSVTVLKSDISHLKHSATRKHALSHASAAKLHKDQTTLTKDEATLKADKSSKHSSSTKRKLSPGDVCCCGAEALAASLRLAGASVAAGDVLELYFNTARDPDEGATVLATLRAAREYGLGGVRPRWFAPCGGAGEVFQMRDGVLDEPFEGDVAAALGAGHGGKDSGLSAGVGLAGVRVHPALNEQVVADLSNDLAVLQFGARVGQYLFRRDAAEFEALVDLVADRSLAHGLILGVDLPGPHAVLATAGGWWSWGELHDPAGWPGAVLEEAWAVAW